MINMDIYKAKKGQEIILITGEKATFVEMRRTKFVFKRNGQAKIAPFEYLKELLPTFDESEKLNEEDPKLFEKGQLFAIIGNTGKSKGIYLFAGIKNSRILGLSLVDKRITRIDASFTFIKLDIDEIKKAL